MNPECLARSKNLTLFNEDLENDALPQWMFITPNMSVLPFSLLFDSTWPGITANDGHDSSVTTAGVFVRRFLEPLLTDSRFMKNTLILLSTSRPLSLPWLLTTPSEDYKLLNSTNVSETAFDETERYFIPNIVFSVLLGDAVPTTAWGTTDDTSYDHYSMAATVENNWDLGNLGLNDMRATRFY
jgi:Phosphoesterase family